jgi:hypothetical protein
MTKKILLLLFIGLSINVMANAADNAKSDANNSAEAVELYAMSPKSNVAPVTISNDVAELQVIVKSKKSLKKSGKKNKSADNNRQYMLDFGRKVTLGNEAGSVDDHLHRGNGMNRFSQF